MTDDDATKDVILARWALSRRYPLCFCRWFVFTLDQHDLAQPIKPYPWEKPHLQWLTRIWRDNRMLFVPKSRQMLVTWWAAMLGLWSALFHQGQLVYFQSKRLEDAVGSETTADGLLGRVGFMLDHIPYRDWVLPHGAVRRRTELIEFPLINSSLVPIAQGGDKIRSHTVSFLITDETALQMEFEDAFLASIASIRRGRWLGITTPDLKDGGQSMRLALDLPDEGGA